MPQLIARFKRWLPLVFAVVMGLLAVALINRYLTQQRQALERERQKIMSAYQAPVEVVAAAADLPEGQQLDRSHLKTITVPERFVQPYATSSMDDVVGKVTLAPMAVGEQILSNKLRRSDEVPTGSTLSSLTPKGKRAVTIAVDTLAGVGGFIRPGDLIDVLLSLQVPTPGQSQPGQVTLTLFQDVPVLAIDRDTQPVHAKEPEGTSKQSPQPPQQPQQQFMVTLALTPQETAFLLFARDQGRIQLSLRPRQETGTQVTIAPANSTTLSQYLFGQEATSPQAQKPAPEPQSVEVYKGLERSVVVLDKTSQ